MEDCLALPGVGTCTCGLWLPPNKTLGEPRETRADVMRRPMDSSMGTGFDSRRPLTPVADDAPLIAPDGTDLVPHQHCNWGASIAFDGDI